MESHKLELQKRQAELDIAFEAVNHKLTIYSQKEKSNLMKIDMD